MEPLTFGLLIQHFSMVGTGFPNYQLALLDGESFWECESADKAQAADEVFNFIFPVIEEIECT